MLATTPGATSAAIAAAVPLARRAGARLLVLVPHALPPAIDCEEQRDSTEVVVGAYRDLVTELALMTAATTLLFGVVYPLAMTAVAQLLFPAQANGQLLVRNGQPIGSRVIGQSFLSPAFFHGRPSAADTGYDTARSGGSNLGPTNKKLIAGARSSWRTSKDGSSGSSASRASTSCSSTLRSRSDGR